MICTVLVAATLQNEAETQAGQQLAALQEQLEKAWGPVGSAPFPLSCNEFRLPAF